MSMNINNAFQQQSAQRAQLPTKKLVKAGDQNGDKKMDFAELQKLQQRSQANPIKFKQDFSMNGDQLAQFQKLLNQQNFQKAAGKDGQLNGKELGKTLGGSKLNFSA